MLFAVQAYVEDYLHRRGIVDSDGYAVRVANLYFHQRPSMDVARFLRRVARINTVAFANSRVPNRAEFERAMVARLDKVFKKKVECHDPVFPGGTVQERARLAGLPRRTIWSLLREFVHAVEARAVHVFWESRQKGKLERRPEKIAQGLLLMFAEGVLGNRGLVLRELSSGWGYVDVGVTFSSVLHLIELKVLTKDFNGVEQLAEYMRTERRSEGSLVVVDTLPPGRKLYLPKSIITASGVIKVYRLDVNAPSPSSLNQPSLLQQA